MGRAGTVKSVVGNRIIIVKSEYDAWLLKATLCFYLYLVELQEAEKPILKIKYVIENFSVRTVAVNKLYFIYRYVSKGKHTSIHYCRENVATTGYSNPSADLEVQLV